MIMKTFFAQLEIKAAYYRRLWFELNSGSFSLCLVKVIKAYEFVNQQTDEHYVKFITLLM